MVTGIVICSIPLFFIMGLQKIPRTDCYMLDQRNKGLHLHKGFKYKLVRENDGMVHRGTNVFWVDLNPDKTCKSHSYKPALEARLLIDGRMPFVWLTSPVTEILVNEKNKVRFKTESFIYTLTNLKP